MAKVAGCQAGREQQKRGLCLPKEGIWVGLGSLHSFNKGFMVLDYWTATLAPQEEAQTFRDSLQPCWVRKGVMVNFEMHWLYPSVHRVEQDCSA
ncbi:hypothetical protein BURKHO8Y_210619 [Burkholderia sp. 8Y]|nr:hypothetical protein BURKHO8Y_210619 [Burkholderia sp. 8Y]